MFRKSLKLCARLTSSCPSIYVARDRPIYQPLYKWNDLTDLNRRQRKIVRKINYIDNRLIDLNKGNPNLLIIRKPDPVFARDYFHNGHVSSKHWFMGKGPSTGPWNKLIPEEYIVRIAGLLLHNGIYSPEDIDEVFHCRFPPQSGNILSSPLNDWLRYVEKYPGIIKSISEDKVMQPEYLVSNEDPFLPIRRLFLNFCNYNLMDNSMLLNTLLEDRKYLEEQLILD